MKHRHRNPYRRPYTEWPALLIALGVAAGIGVVLWAMGVWDA